MNQISTRKTLTFTLPYFKAGLFLILLFKTSLIYGQQKATSYPSAFYRSTINYYEYLPPSYSSSNNSFPLLIYLHGTGEAGTNLSSTLVQGIPPKLIAEGKTDGLNNFIVLSPQSPRTYWYPSFVDEFIEMAKNKYRIDISRIYLTGISAGGRGIWDYTIAYPEKIAAILPIAAVTVNPNVCDAKDVPVWSFQGQNDGKSATNWHNAYNKCNPPVSGKLTVINGAGHNASLWGTVYQNLPQSPARDATGLTPNAIYNWLLEHRKDHTTPNRYPLVFAGNDIIAELPVEKIFLSGTASDEDGTIKQSYWRQLAGPSQITFSNITALSTNAYGFIEGEYTLELKVTDNQGASASDQVKVLIQRPTLTDGTILYRINCGGSEIEDPILNWALDKQVLPSEYLEKPVNSRTTGSDTWKGPNNSDAPNNVFGNHRYTFQTNTPLQWSFPVSPGQYLLKLYFSDAKQEDNTRLINVYAEGKELLRAFDIHKTFGESGGQKNFTIEVIDGSLDLSLTASLNLPKIDGIEISRVGTSNFRTEALSSSASSPFYFRFYPEPAEENLTLEFNFPEEDVAKVELLDQKGMPVRILYEGTIQPNQVIDVQLTSEGIAGGLYFITFRSNTYNTTQKLLLRK
jgi:predicted esterase